MKIKSKIAFATTIIGLLLAPINIVNAKDNIPNTSLSDTDKISPCEVTADIHYAYYISLPASLTLEPMDLERTVKKWSEMTNMTESDVLSMNDEDWYNCWYQVKAKTKDGGLGDKYIKVAPRTDKESFTANYLQSGLSQEKINGLIEDGNLDCFYLGDYGEADVYRASLLLQKEDIGDWHGSFIYQKRIYFGDMARDKVVKVDSSKWSSIDGVAMAYLRDQGSYKGNFDFVYGLVDSID